ncbi:hypothetical protein BDN71DRAFT_1457929 [Pleurotus eryngii]|uniref:Uncharacterized protein n=1 Tax=Pleurotus eryngii TaxID=5323 RepID=A0A9P5ZJS3_PLEER|nr:hypothetical protein BDN71DRAFT_1457929 [Pleurotus eryngii]
MVVGDYLISLCGYDHCLRGLRTRRVPVPVTPPIQLTLDFGLTIWINIVSTLLCFLRTIDWDIQDSVAESASVHPEDQHEGEVTYGMT